MVTVAWRQKATGRYSDQAADRTPEGVVDGFSAVARDLQHIDSVQTDTTTHPASLSTGRGEYFSGD